MPPRIARPQEVPLAEDPGVTRESIAGSAGQSFASSKQYRGIDVLRYPEMLTNDDNPHYVMFFINVPNNSVSSTKKSDSATGVKYDQTAQNRVKTDNASVTETLALGLGASGVALASVSAGKAITSLASGEVTRALRAAGRATITALVGGLTGAAVGAAAGEAFGGTQLVHIPKAIALQVQTNPSFSYGADWQDQDMGLLGAINRSDFGDGLGKGVARELALNAATLPKVAGLGFDFKAFVNKAQRKVLNPHKEQLFKGVGFRKFEFNYLFMPRNAGEAQMVKDIITTFRIYMHPDTDASKMFLVYPAEFNIIYYYKDTENEYLQKISSCALTNLDVSYGGNDFTTFANSGGIPTEVSLRLQFSEMETLTSQRIEQGF